MSYIFLACDFPPSRGGIQTVAYELPLALCRAGQEVGVVATCQEGASEVDASCPYPVVRVPAAGMGQTAANLAAGAAEMARQLGGRPEAIIATKWFPEGLGAILTLRPRTPPIAMIAHGREFAVHGGRPLKWLGQRFILKRIALGFAVSRWTGEQLARAGVPRHRIRVVHNGIRPEVFSEPGDVERLRETLGIGPGPVLLTTGRLIPRKGHADVIRLLPRIMERVGPVSYVIVGGGPMEGSLREMTAALGLAERVIFAGSPDNADLPTYYHLADVFVMPTREIAGEAAEGFGIVYLEANAAGKPVVATDCGGVADAVEDGVSGCLVPPEDDEALVEAICGLLADPARARKLGESGRRRVYERFTWDLVAAQYLEGLRELRR